jgi:hypothetical protein
MPIIEETMTEQTPATATETPTDAAALAALTQTEPVEPAATEPAPEPVAARITIPDSVISEMTGLRSRARDAETELAKARREAADARALAERLQRGNGQTDPAPAPAPPAPAQSPDQYNADVQRAAELQRVMEDTVAVKNAGIVKFPDFQQSLNTLTALGVTSNLDIVMDILAAAGRDNAHVMLDRLAKDPEKAASIAQMTPRARIAELTRMTTVTAAAPAPKPATPAAPAAPVRAVSRAPAPAPVVEPSASKPAPHWLSDDNSEEQVTAGFNEMLKKRAGQR